MHGSFRVLRDLKGMQIMGLTLMFSPELFQDWKEGARHCRYYCLAALTCEWWQYSTIGGCFVEDVSKARVKYPLTTDASHSVTSTEFANSMVAGEYIQHLCGVAVGTEGLDALFSTVDKENVAGTEG